MFGIHFIKVQPTTYLLRYSRGKLVQEGQGLAFFYFAPTTSLVAIPLESLDAPFIFEQMTADFQEISIQGQLTYRITDPKKIVQFLNLTLSAKHTYVSEDLDKLPQRLINSVQVLMQGAIAKLNLRQALAASDDIVKKISTELRESNEVQSLGLEVLGFSILAIKPTPETLRALEADVREQLFREADQAVYARRNAAVEQERTIKENELNTDIAVENKKRQIREAQMEAERSIQEKQYEIQEAAMQGKIALENLNKSLVALQTENLRLEADAKAYELTAFMQAIAGVDVKVLQALASAKMKPDQLIAFAFRDLADSAEKIGQLNVTPDLLKELLKK